MYCYERTLLRARFDRYKNEKDFTKATQLLRLGEEEFWENQAPAPSVFPNEPDGVTFQRFWTNQVPIENFSEIEQMLLFLNKLHNDEKHQTRVSLSSELISDAYLTANRT